MDSTVGDDRKSSKISNCKRKLLLFGCLMHRMRISIPRNKTWKKESFGSLFFISNQINNMNEEQNPLSFLGMTAEERKTARDDNPPTCEGVHNASVYFDWSWIGCGFGQLRFNYIHETDMWTVDNECMGPESVRKLLHAFADHVADNLKPIILEGMKDL